MTRADRGRWDHPEWERHHRERRRWEQRRRGPWKRLPAFGCLFAFLFLAIVAVMLWSVLMILDLLGPVTGLLALAVVVIGLIGLARGFRQTGRTLDRLVDAAGRVETGDYSVRIGVVRGVRPLRQLAHGFDTMVERLDADEQQRRMLLADVSHELRTPLAVIAGNLEAMIDGVHQADEEHLSAILEETRMMERLIDDLRTMVLSDAGTLPLHREPVEIEVLIEEVVRSFAGSARMDGVTVRADVPGDLPIVDVDPVRIRQVLTNLVANGITHTPTGGSVTVTASIADPWLELLVRDTGRGIDPTILPDVFDRFVKTPGSGGSGLGLAIARSLTEAHGGTLDVTATGSDGTTFRLRLPLARS